MNSKKITLSKKLSVILVCILMLGLTLGLALASSASDEIVVSARISEKNLDYRSKIHFVFTVEFDEDAPEGTRGIAMWYDGMQNYTMENSIYSTFVTHTASDGKVYYRGASVGLDELNKVFRVAAVVKNGDNITICSTPETYSVTAYANERIKDLADIYADVGTLTEAEMKQKNLYNTLLALAGVPSSSFDEIKPYSYTESSILSLKGGAGGAVAIVHDDGDLTTFNLLDQILVDNGLVADVALIANKVYNFETNTVKTNELNAFSEYINNGRWSIVNHSATHEWWSTIDQSGTPVINRDKLTKEVVTSQEILRELFPEHRVLTFAYPGFSAYEKQFGDPNDSEMLKKYIYSTEARELIMKHHISARNSRANAAPKVTDEIIDWDWVLGYFLTPERVTKHLKDVLDYGAMSGQIMITSIHALTEDPDIAATPGGYYLLNDYMKTACEMIAERVNSGKLWNAHYEDIALYVREARNASIEAILDEQNGKITVNLTDTLDDNIYNHALTVRVKIPENWKSVKVEHNGKSFITAVKNVDGKQVVDFDIVPDKGVAILTPEITTENETLNSEFGIVLSNGSKLDANYFPGFVRKAVTFTIDDGIVAYDTKFINIVKPAGILGTFNLINTSSNRNGLTNEQYVALYEGFEVANHHVYHPLPWFGFDGFDAEDFADVPIHETIIYNDSIKNELDSSYIYKTDVEGLYYIDYNYHFAKNYSTKYWHPIMTNEAYAKYVDQTKSDIEGLFGEGSVVGFAFPHGKLNDDVKQYLANSGYLYARKTTGSSDNVTFNMPADRYAWSYNANHTNLNSLMAQFNDLTDDGNLKFFSFGVHSSDYNGKWDVLQSFADTYGNRPEDFYYASNRDIFEYEDAVKALMIKDGMLLNASDITLYVTINNVKTIIPAHSVYSVSNGSISEYKSTDFTGWSLLQ